MDTEEKKLQLIAKIDKLASQYLNIDDETRNHGHRFVNKLSKYNLIKDNLDVNALDDGNLGFEWKFEKPKHAKFNIDFDKSVDRLMWCCYIDGMKDNLFGSVLHLEEILPYVKRFLGIK